MPSRKQARNLRARLVLGCSVNTASDGEPLNPAMGGYGSLIALGLFLVFSASVWLKLPQVVGPGRMATLQVDTSGVPHLGGFALGSKTLRRVVFRALGHSRAYVVIVVPHRGLGRTNWVRELEAEMVRARITGAIHGPSE